MKIKAMILSLAALVLTLAGCGGAGSGAKSAYPATDDGAKAMLKEFLKPGADNAALSKQLRPTKEDYEAFFQPEFAAKAAATYDSAWDAGQLVVSPNNPERTAVTLISTTSDEMKSWTGTAATEFAGGWKDVAANLKPGVKIYRFKFVKPGETDGMVFDGLANVNGNWRIFPKPWRIK